MQTDSIIPSTITRIIAPTSQCEPIGKILESINPLEKIKQNRLEYQTTGRISLPGISTGYSEIDNSIGGLQAEHLIILAARTGMGKSWVALNLIKNIAIDKQIPTALFSLEMSHKQIINRLISLISKVPLKKINDGTMNDEEFAKVVSAVATIGRSSLMLTDNSKNSTLTEAINNIDIACENDKAQLVIIDHIGLMKTSNKMSENRVVEMGSIVRELKLAAKRTKVPVMGLAQLNRDADKNEPPKLSNLRESGAIEQDADVIMFIHRNNYYNASERPGELDIIIAKNRDGEDNSTVEFSYDECWNIKEKNNTEQGVLAGFDNMGDKQKVQQAGTKPQHQPSNRPVQSPGGQGEQLVMRYKDLNR